MSCSSAAYSSISRSSSSELVQRLRSGRTGSARGASTCCECSRSEPHRRARPATAARRSARGSSDQSSGSCTRTASSTMPSRSAQSLVTISSMSNTSKIVASSVTPAGSSSARLSSMPGQPAPLGGRHLHDAALQRVERVGLDPQPVRARRDVAVVAGRGEPREVVDRAARARPPSSARGRAPRRRSVRARRGRVPRARRDRPSTADRSAPARR